LKAGIIGFGIGEQHIYGYKKAGIDVVAICDKDKSKRLEAKEKFPNCEIFEHDYEILDLRNIDIISIASYDQDHAHQVIKAIDSGKHVFCEKPLCMNESELKSIKNSLDKNPHVHLSTNTILRMSQRFRDIKKRIKRNELGEIYCIEGDYNYGRLNKITQGWRSRVIDYSVVLGGGIHMIDLLLWLVGSTVEEVSAFGNNICSKSSSFKYLDMVTSLIRFKNGAVGKISANFGCVYPHFHKVTVYGTKGTFENRIDGALIINSRDINKSPNLLNSEYPGLKKGDLIPSFVNSITTKSEAEVSKTDVFDVMSICLAINKSLKNKKTESVKYI